MKHSEKRKVAARLVALAKTMVADTAEDDVVNMFASRLRSDALYEQATFFMLNQIRKIDPEVSAKQSKKLAQDSARSLVDRFDVAATEIMVESFQKEMAMLKRMLKKK